jgi:phospholipid/cholesterol/gamma-HCH transport system substrate-binding protein
MTRVNKGEGSVGMLLNDPVYAQEIQKAIQGVNQLLNRVAKVRFVPDLGGAYLGGINGGRGWFNLGIWPKPERYYLIGIAGDSRGRILNTDVSTTVAGSSPVVVTSQVVDYTMMVFTAMMGKVYNERWDLSVGLLYGDGALSAKLNLGGKDWRDQIQLGSDVYLRIGGGPNLRAYLSVQPVKGFYLRGGMEALPVGSTGITTPATYFAGGGITFDDEDIKLLFALK